MTYGRKVFQKPPLDLAGQLALLEERGLGIPDRERAQRYLKYIGYYRLAVYCRPYQRAEDASHAFKPGVCFDDVLNLYIFDRQLRLLVMDAVERIEVAFRTVLSDHMSIKYGHQWYTDFLHFSRNSKNFNHLQLIRMIQKETGFPGSGAHGPAFCRAYYEKYSDPVLPPSWMIAEILPIGSWSRIYSVLTSPEDRKAVSNSFSVRYELFGSWIHAVSYVRNICAHHSLLWNATFTVKPKLKDEFGVVDHNDRFYAQALVIQHFIRKITNSSTWGSRLKQHVLACPLPYERHMGFPQDCWEQRWWVS